MLTSATPDHLPALSRIIAMAFGGDVDGARKWLESAGLENVRILPERDGQSEVIGAGGEPAGILLRVPMGHFFGGRSVPCLGIAGVAVPPEQRGGGVASRLMGAALREAHEEGFPLSSLYPATQPLYRRVGYEQAWHRIAWTIPLSRVRIDPSEPPVWRADATDESVQAAIKRVYGQFARTQSAMLDRGPYVWGRVFTPRDVSVSVLMIGRRDEPEGYIVLSQERDPKTGRHDVALFDTACTTPRAWARALGVLGRFRTTGNDLRFFAGPTHPWFRLDVEQVATPSKSEFGMLRIVRLVEAIEGRGYPPGVSARAELDVTDDTLPENAGRWSVRVEDGRAKVVRGSAGADTGRAVVRLSINALASLYTGFISGRQAAECGWADGPNEGLDALTAMFAGPTPWVPNMF